MQGVAVPAASPRASSTLLALNWGMDTSFLSVVDRDQARSDDDVAIVIIELMLRQLLKRMDGSIQLLHIEICQRRVGLKPRHNNLD